jgi:hypothetical protein
MAILAANVPTFARYTGILDRDELLLNLARFPFLDKRAPSARPHCDRLAERAIDGLLRQR